MYQMLGHDGEPQGYWRENLVTEAALTRCPLRTVQLAGEDETTRRLAREVDRYTDVLYPAYEAGHLLVAGGVADQPARYLDLLEQVRVMDELTQVKLLKLTAAPDGGH